MTEAFASAVVVTVPILALAAGAEARAVRDRLRRPDSEWEKKFEAHAAAHEFDPAKPPTEVLEYFVKVLLTELEGAIDRASEKSLSTKETPAVAGDGEPAEPK